MRSAFAAELAPPPPPPLAAAELEGTFTEGGVARMEVPLIGLVVTRGWFDDEDDDEEEACLAKFCIAWAKFACVGLLTLSLLLAWLVWKTKTIL